MFDIERPGGLVCYALITNTLLNKAIEPNENVFDGLVRDVIQTAAVAGLFLTPAKEDFDRVLATYPKASLICGMILAPALVGTLVSRCLTKKPRPLISSFCRQVTLVSVKLMTAVCVMDNLYRQ